MEFSVLDFKIQLELHENETLSNLLREKGYHSKTDLLAIKRFLNTGKTFIDIGANIGWHALIAAHYGNVIAFEPEPRNAALLRKNARGHNIRVHEAALSNSNGTIELFLNSENYGDHSVSHNTHLRRFDTTTGPESITVPSYRLDLLLDLEEFLKVDLIKIDAQGSEPRILEGMRGLLESHKPSILLEYSPAHIYSSKSSPFEIFAFIENNNYCVYKITDDTTVAEMMTVESLFRETEKNLNTFKATDLLLVTDKLTRLDLRF